ncbi:MAG: ThiF family adenylyltransferase [Bacilli bacterium]|nr:ThiF family adenylyltransferase [Bacilli bacterium]
MNGDIFERSRALLGEEAFSRLADSHVVVFGVGGVGGTAAESLLRSGVGKLTLVDFDVVDPSNLNRQILFVSEDVGKRKVEAAKKRLLSINPQAKIEIINEKIGETFFDFHPLKADFFLDAVDDLSAKLTIAKYCLKNHFRFLMSLGMGNRISPEGFKLITLNQSEYDPLARKLRHLFKEAGIDMREVRCVQALKQPDMTSPTPASLMMVPSSAGLYLSACALKELVKKPEEE